MLAVSVVCRECVTRVQIALLMSGFLSADVGTLSPHSKIWMDADYLPSEGFSKPKKYRWRTGTFACGHFRLCKRQESYRSVASTLRFQSEDCTWPCLRLHREVLFVFKTVISWAVVIFFNNLFLTGTFFIPLAIFICSRSECKLHKWIIFIAGDSSRQNRDVMFAPKIYKYPSGWNMQRLLSAHQRCKNEANWTAREQPEDNDLF